MHALLTIHNSHVMCACTPCRVCIIMFPATALRSRALLLVPLSGRRGAAAEACGWARLVGGFRWPCHLRPFPFLTGAIPRRTRTAGWMAPRAESRTLRGGCYAAGPLGPKGVPLLEGCGELLSGEILGVGDHCVVCCVCGSAAGGAVARASLRKRGFCSGRRGAEVSRPGSLF